MPDEKLFFSTAEHKLHVALQLLAVCIDRLGGEIIIERKEFEFFGDCQVVGKDYGTHVVLRLGDEDDQGVELSGGV
jgi:hypothetical protein